MSGIYIKGLKTPEEADDATIVHLFGGGRVITKGMICRDRSEEE